MPERLMTTRVHMPQLNRDRNVRIYLPPDYFANLGRRYPVLYMHDGQNLFEPSKLSGFSWEVNRTLDRLFELDPQRYAFIVVGIDSSTVGTRRLDEYCPWQCRIYETPENPWNYTLVDGEDDKAKTTIKVEIDNPSFFDIIRDFQSRAYDFINKISAELTLPMTKVRGFLGR